jgi:histidinol phosphatase-like enzyme (inositol monophosphatase family)
MADDQHIPIKSRLEWAITIAREAGRLTLAHFRQAHLSVERKADDSPVTVADREAEQSLRAKIMERFPADAILGEEFGKHPGTSDYCWVLDPIDGTKSFIHGVPLYTTLVAVMRGDEPLIGVVHAPACNETVYAARGSGCWYVAEQHQTTPVPARVSNVDRMDQALLLVSEVAPFGDRRRSDAIDVYLQLQKKVRLARTWGDAYGYLMVATGRAEIMIDPVMNLWDAAPLQPIIEEAGGRFTDWRGQSTVHSGEAVATNGLLADEVLAVTRGR